MVEPRIKAGLPPVGSYEDVARRWFDVKQIHWMASYSVKVTLAKAPNAISNGG